MTSWDKSVPNARRGDGYRISVIDEKYAFLKLQDEWKHLWNSLPAVSVFYPFMPPKLIAVQETAFLNHSPRLLRTAKADIYIIIQTMTEAKRFYRV